jgi:hypothetical protein
MRGSSDFFMCDQAWNCWLMHVSSVAMDRNTSTGPGVQGEASRQSVAKGAAGMKTCAAVNPSDTVRALSNTKGLCSFSGSAYSTLLCRVLITMLSLTTICNILGLLSLPTTAQDTTN